MFEELPRRPGVGLPSCGKAGDCLHTLAERGVRGEQGTPTLEEFRVNSLPLLGRQLLVAKDAESLVDV